MEITLDVRRIVQRGLSSMQDADHVSVTPSATGRAKQVYRVESPGATYALLTCEDPADHGAAFRTNTAVGRYLDEAGIAPTVVEYGEDPEHYVLMDWVSGENLDRAYGAMPRRQQARILHSLGEELGQQHATTTLDTYGTVTSQDGRTITVTGPDRWEDALHELMGRRQEQLADTLFADPLADALPVIESALDQAYTDTVPVIHNQDLRPGNVLVDNDSVNGIVDWDWSAAVDSAYSLVRAEDAFIDRFDRDDLHRSALWTGYKRANKLSDDFFDRRPVYRVLSVVEDMTGLTQYYEERNEPLPEDEAQPLIETFADRMAVLENV